MARQNKAREKARNLTFLRTEAARMEREANIKEADALVSQNEAASLRQAVAGTKVLIARLEVEAAALNKKPIKSSGPVVVTPSPAQLNFTLGTPRVYVSVGGVRERLARVIDDVLAGAAEPIDGNEILKRVEGIAGTGIYTKAQVHGVLVKKKAILGWAPTGMGRYTRWYKVKEQTKP